MYLFREPTNKTHGKKHADATKHHRRIITDNTNNIRAGEREEKPICLGFMGSQTQTLQCCHRPVRAGYWFHLHGEEEQESTAG